jgi:nitrate/nitrite transport system permease protein
MTPGEIMSTLVAITERNYTGLAARFKAIMHTLLQEVAVPLFGICCFLMVWSIAANHIDTSLGKFPGPATV